MTGPKELGFWSNLRAPNIGTQYGILSKGQKYRVIKVFTDYDGTTHKAGETWTFLASAFLPHDDGLQWIVTLDNLQEWAIPLWLADERYQEVAHHLESYIENCKLAD